MAWIEYHSALRDHWKIKRLAVTLNIPYPYALGIISCLWLWAIEYARNGNLSKFTDAEIREAAKCNDEKFCKKLLLRCELVDKKTFINDWDKHGLKYLNSLKNRVKKHRRMKRYSNVTVTPTLPYLTLPNQTNTITPGNGFSAAAFFEKIWQQYPVKDGRKQAYLHFKASVKSLADWNDIQAALQTYLKSEKVKRGFIKDGKTWFNNWRDWIQNPVTPVKASSTVESEEDRIRAMAEIEMKAEVK